MGGSHPNRFERFTASTALSGSTFFKPPALPEVADYRLGHILEARFAANLHTVLSALALQALAGYALPPPWLHPDTTPMALYGA